MHSQDMPGLTSFKVAETIAVLTRTPAVLKALLHGLPSVWVRGTEGKNTWSAIDVISHMVFAECTNWMPRVRIVMDSGEARPFDPFDRFSQLKENQGKSLEQLLAVFDRLRNDNLAALQALDLQRDDMDRIGKHPALGVVKLSELLATWAVHDLTHLHQLSRVMAHQYRELVGPWSAYLGVLRCAGHSD